MRTNQSGKSHSATRSPTMVNLIKIAAESMTDMEVFSFVQVIKKIYNKEQEARASQIKQVLKNELRDW